jgi:hypothetical protein
MRGSPRRSGSSGVAGSGQRGGVPVEGGSGRVVTFSGAVRWLEAEASEGSAGAASERRRKHSAGEKNPAGDGITLLKGGDGKQRRGVGESGGAWGRAGEKEGARAWRKTARAADIGLRPAGSGGGVAALQR